MLSVPDERLFLRPADGVASLVLDGEAVVYSEVTAGVHVLDPIATLVWERLDAREPLAAVIASLSRRFAADATVIRDDVHRLVARLSEQRLLTVVDGAGG